MNKFLKKFFKTKDEDNLYRGGVETTHIYSNPYIDLIHDACSLCYRREVVDKNFVDRIDYVRRRANSGHESILEHSNVINHYLFSTSYMEELAEVLIHCKYLNAKIVTRDNKVHLLLGGSVRGYKHIVRTIKNPNNAIYKAILETMYDMHSSLFTDFIEAGIMKKHEFRDEVIEDNLTIDKGLIENLKTCSIQNMDPLFTIMNTIKKFDLPFNKEDLLHMTTITIRFEKVSRVISQQLTRHRAGITQLSQRYVNSTDTAFLSPDMFKPGKYDSNHKYTIKIGDSTQELTLLELGENLVDIYPQLFEQGLLKEDARAFLPNNTETSLYMTFTFIGFIKFLELRVDKHAQAEIQQIALELEQPFVSYVLEDEDTIYDYLEPLYTRVEKDYEESYINVDEIL